MRLTWLLVALLVVLNSIPAESRNGKGTNHTNNWAVLVSRPQTMIGDELTVC